MLRALICAFFLGIVFPQTLFADGNTDITRYYRIDTLNYFREHVADRKMSDRQGNWSIAYSNYRLRDEYGGLKLTAKWSWRQDNWCRKGSLGGQAVNDCWQVEIKGDSLRVRPAGGGRSMTYKLD